MVMNTTGLSADPIWRLIKATILNPLLTLPLLLFSSSSSRTDTDHATTAPSSLLLLKTTRVLFYLGAIKWISDLLSRASINNWQRDTYDWSKEIIVITGGSDGIGARVVQLLAQARPEIPAIVILDIQDPTFPLTPNTFFYNCDITQPSMVAQTTETIRSKHGDPTILINNAGVARGKTILDSTETDIRLTFDVNTLSHYWLLQSMVPAMIRSNHGMIVTIASLAAYSTLPQLADYAASKAAAVSLHEGLAAELVGRYKAPKVRTVLVTTGYTRTALFEGFRNTSTWLFPVLEVDTVAKAIVDRVLRGESAHVVLPVAAGFVPGVRGVPGWVGNLVRNGGDESMRLWKGRQVLVDEVLEGRYKKKM